jgi:hypothetical protein
MAHSPNLHRCRHRYVGILSSYRHLDIAQDIDYLFVISGYLLEHKEGFVRRLLAQARELPGRKVFVLGAAGDDKDAYGGLAGPDLEIHSVASGALRQELFNRACYLVSRAGYTTVMDLAEHDKPAVLIPTPNQTEQEYLAFHLSRQGYFIAQPQGPKMDIAEALRTCRQTARFDAPWRTHDSVRRIVETIEPMLHQHTFSIIVPAHNEEKELAATLHSLVEQHYPLNLVEIIVVENGSTDGTPAIAREISEDPTSKGRVRVLQSEPGVSRAKNAGVRALSADAVWVIFCDADTRLGPHFLHHLNTWLNRHGNGVSVGTTAVRRRPARNFYARVWFSYYDLIHRLTKTSYALQIARAPVARGIRFHEDLHFAEDLLFIQECRRYGRFAFIPTDQVTTSTRRFEAHGYLRLSVRWVIEAVLPLRLKLHRYYHAIR